MELDGRFGTEEMEVKAGSTLIIPVNFSGTPAPRVSWYRNGVPLLPIRGHVHIDSGDNYSTLTVLGTEVAEGGKYRCVVENVAGKTDSEFNVKIKSPPQKPESLRVKNILRDSVTLAWEAPERDGGAPVKGYVIERKDASRDTWSTVGTVDALSREFKVRKLLEDNKYHFRVMAENEAGMSEPVETAQSVEVKSPFGEYHELDLLYRYSIQLST